MSFIRPELRDLYHQWFTHWSEGVAVILPAGMGLSLLWTGLAEARPLLGGIGAGLIILAAIFAVAFRRRAQFESDGSGAGVVEVDERRIAYLAPEGGGVVALDALVRVEIMTTDQGPFVSDVFWVLSAGDGTRLMIPSEARDAVSIFDAISALPGVRMDVAVTAMTSTENAIFLIWEAPSGNDTFPQPDLARPGLPH